MSQASPGSAAHQNLEEMIQGPGDTKSYCLTISPGQGNLGAYPSPSFAATSTLTVPVTFASFEASGAPRG